METNEFENFLQKVCFEANPTVLDDDMPDFFDDWLGSQNADDFIRLGNAFCKAKDKNWEEEVKKEVDKAHNQGLEQAYLEVELICLVASNRYRPMIDIMYELAPKLNKYVRK